jgi:hypothetical protein
MIGFERVERRPGILGGKKLRWLGIGYFRFAAPDLQLASTADPRFTNSVESTYCVHLEYGRVLPVVNLGYSNISQTTARWPTVASRCTETRELRKPGPVRNVWLSGRRVQM